MENAQYVHVNCNTNRIVVFLSFLLFCFSCQVWETEVITMDIADVQTEQHLKSELHWQANKLTGDNLEEEGVCGKCSFAFSQD